MGKDMSVSKTYVKDLPRRILENDDGTEIIPQSYDNEEVYYIVNNTRTETGKEVNTQLNIRFICKQLNINTPDIDKRELWYIVRNALGGKIDLKGSSDQQYISFSSQIKSFCEKVAETMQMPFNYWGFALEYLGVPSKDTVIAYDSSLKTKALTVDDISKYSDVPFFIVVCEKKSTLDDFVNEMYKRGYKRGFFGFVLGGYAITTVIRLILALKGKEKFILATLVDYDLNGIQIMMDMCRYADAENVIPIGVHDEILQFGNLEFDDLAEDYKPEKLDDLVLGCQNMVDELGFDQEYKNVILGWIERCKYRRVELNAITAYNIRKKISKVGVFADYFEMKIKDKIWDLNREITPSVSPPDYIRDYMSEIQQKAIEKFEEYLENNGLRWSNDWLNAIEELKETYNMFVEQNKNYNGKLDQDIDKLIRRQNKELKNILTNSDLYSETKVKLKVIKDITLEGIQQIKYEA